MFVACSSRTLHVRRALSHCQPSSPRQTAHPCGLTSSTRQADTLLSLDGPSWSVVTPEASAFSHVNGSFVFPATQDSLPPCNPTVARAAAITMSLRNQVRVGRYAQERTRLHALLGAAVGVHRSDSVLVRLLHDLQALERSSMALALQDAGQDEQTCFPADIAVTSVVATAKAAGVPHSVRFYTRHRGLTLSVHLSTLLPPLYPVPSTMNPTPDTTPHPSPHAPAACEQLVLALSLPLAGVSQLQQVTCTFLARSN